MSQRRRRSSMTATRRPDGALELHLSPGTHGSRPWCAQCQTAVPDLDLEFINLLFGDVKFAGEPYGVHDQLV